jgi:hypothetical protein
MIIYSGGTWSDPVSIDSGSELTGVSCPSSTFCVAVDNGGNAFTYTGTATQWSRTTLDPNQDDIASISCPDTKFCAAVDQAGNTYTYNGYSWNPPDNVDNGNEFTQVSCHSAKVDGNNTFAAVSCVAVNTCTAADQYDNVMYYTPSSRG